MAEFTEVTKQWKRMCDEGCPKCLLGSLSDCLLFIKDNPQQAEDFIMSWAKDHPVITNADKFKEVFGDIATLNECNFLECEDGTGDCSKCKCKDFWQQEYKEPKE